MPRIRLGHESIWAWSHGAGEDVVLIAGLADDSSSWDAQVTVLSRHYRVTVIDNRGVGHSSTPPGPWTIGDFARDTLGVLDALQIRRAHVVGSSLGAATAQELAAAAPGRVRSLILNGSWRRSDDGFRILLDSWIAAARESSSLPELLAVINLSVYPASLQAGHLIERWLDDPQPERRPSYAVVRAGFIAAAEALRDYDAGDRLRRIAAPTLLTVGSEDDVLPPRHARELAALIPDARLAVFEGCGHHPFEEEPDRFNALAAEFFARASRPAVAA
ncbi:MAG: alpha/beta fold hydrolase [Solirubrobacteraceae bacterium]|jgi:pimeloyl-ACP methyl ester carboxylesterase